MTLSLPGQTVDYLGDLIKHSFWKENAEKVCDDEADIKGKIVIVTGSNTGIGKQTALQIAKRGAVVIMAVRDLEKGQAALDDIKKSLEGQEVNINLMKLDLGDLQSIRDFVTAFQAKHTHLNILINNAGIMDTNSVLKKTKDGFEQHIGVNHLGPFLLTRLLIPSLQKGSPSRIVCVSTSNIALVPLELEDLMMEKKVKTGFLGQEPYNISKLCNSVCMLKLAADGVLGNDIKLMQLCPGLVKSDVFRNDTGFLRKLKMGISLGAVGITTHQGCETAVYGAVSKTIFAEENSGKGEMYRLKKLWAKGDKILKDYLVAPKLEKTEQLYKLSEELVGLRDIVR